MRRFFVKNILFILSVNILVKTIWAFFIDRTVQNRVGHDAYGTYASIFNLGLILASFNIGITNYNSRTIAQDHDKLTSTFPMVLSTQLFFLLLSAITVLIMYGLGYGGVELTMLAGVLVIQSLSVLLQFLRSNVAALQRFKLDGLLSVSDRLLMVLVCGILLYLPFTAGKFKIEWFVIAQIVCYLTACGIAFVLLKLLHPVHLRLTFSRAAISKVIKDSFPYVLLIILMTIYNRADMVLLKWLGGNEQAGIYAASFRLLDYAIQFAGMFAVMLLPFFGKMLSQKQDVQPIIQLCVNMLLPVSFMVAVGAAFFGNDIMHLLYKQATVYDGHIISWLMASFPAWCMMYVYSTLLTANGNLKLLNKIAVAGVVLNLTLNFYLIPMQHALGAAMASFITQTLLAILFICFSTSIFKLPVKIKWLTAHTAFLVVAWVLAYGIVQLHLNWMPALLLYGAVCVALMFVLRFVSVRAILQLMNKQ